MSVSAGVLSRLERKIYTYIMSVSASTFALRSIFLFEQELRTARVLRNHLWCFFTFRTKNIHIYVCFCRCSFTFRTKNIHIYHVCFCQHLRATIDIPFRARIANRTRFKNHLWCPFTFRTKNIHIYVCFCRCSFTFETKNIHIYQVCFCQHLRATIDIPFRARIANRTRFKKSFVVFFHV